MRAIETRYDSHLFRSRLEARWACMFDLLGWEWTYEPFDGNFYIPDFALLGPGPVLVEVKPAVSLAGLTEHAEHVADGIRSHWNGDYLIVGANVTFGKAIGWHGQCAEWWTEEPHWTGAPAFWHRCCVHRTFAFHHQNTYLSQPCGCDHVDRDCLGRVHAEDLKALRGRAHEQSRWTR
jgi:hypothetical protein